MKAVVVPSCIDRNDRDRFEEPTDTEVTKLLVEEIYRTLHFVSNNRNAMIFNLKNSPGKDLGFCHKLFEVRPLNCTQL